MQGTYRLIGALASPYSMKMRAIMRYRRLPFVWQLREGRVREETQEVRPSIIPILGFPEDGTFHVDSTPLAYELERRHPGERSLIPDDPADAFLSHLIEDMADEWGTKIMFHYRWAYEEDQEFCARWLGGQNYGRMTEEQEETAIHTIRERQMGRMALVGCTEENRPLIEETYGRVLDALEAHFATMPFLFGSRPALADFGWFGQLSQLAIDPVPMRIMRERAPRVYHWLARIDDASGIEGAWRDAEQEPPPAVTALLKLAGDVYLPFLAANAAAIDNGLDAFSAEIMGRPYSQAVFRYQRKCLDWLRQEFAKLDGIARDRAKFALAETGGYEIIAGI